MIEVKEVSKTLKKREILKNISYTFENGKIYGLYGRNGCGKTMLLRALAGLIFLDKGEICVDDKVLHKDMDFPKELGIIIENTALLPQYTGRKNMEILAAIKRVATKEDIENALIQVGLDPDDKRKVKEYSLGMKQRLAIAQAIFERPKILLLDEPSNALDEESIEKVHVLLTELRDLGTLIILASHSHEDIDVLADIKIHMVDGKIVE